MKKIKLNLMFIIFIFGVSGSFALAAPKGKIALVQYNADLHFGQYDENRNALTNFANQAVQQRSEMIVFPEGSLYGYADGDHLWCRAGHRDPRCVDVAGAAEKIPGGRSEIYWSNYAREHQVYMIYNLPEVDAASGLYFNATVVSGPNGFVTKYRKQKLYVTDTYYASAGQQNVILETPLGRWGLAICMDATNPGIIEDYRAQGADGVIITMDWDQNPHSQFAAYRFFVQRARSAGIDLLIADVSAWDGTGAYFKNKKSRDRPGLPDFAVDLDGIAYIQF